MIGLFIQTYFTVLLSVALISGAMLMLGIFFIFKNQQPAKPTDIEPLWRHPLADADKANIEIDDLNAIAGENLFSTQLDLARAYIETDHPHLAKEILDAVLLHGTDTQRQEAQRLLINCRA